MHLLTMHLSRNCRRRRPINSVAFCLCLFHYGALCGEELTLFELAPAFKEMCCLYMC